jgi:serine/threonine protein kinase
LPPRDAIARAVELLSTLAAVHARGVVHGDVKPANLLFRDAGDDSELVLGDFGLAQLVGDGDEARAARGTLAYMAPEQRRGQLAPAADVYAAGVILVELCAGSVALAPWLGDRAALLRGDARWSGTLPPPVENALGARASELRRLVAALLAGDAAARPTAQAAAAVLASLL